MKTFNWALGLLTVGVILIVSDISIQALKPDLKHIAVPMGITGTALVLIATIMLFVIKPEIKIV